MIAETSAQSANSVASIRLTLANRPGASFGG
jgi:hypothetical protein